MLICNQATVKGGSNMYISTWGEKIVIDKIQTNTYLEPIMAGITYPNPSYRIMHNISNKFPKILITNLIIKQNHLPYLMTISKK